MQETNTQLTGFDNEVLDKASHVEALEYISMHAKSMVGAERCSIFVYNRDEDELSTTLADGTEKIIIPYDIGIVGQTIRVAKEDRLLLQRHLFPSSKAFSKKIAVLLNNFFM